MNTDFVGVRICGEEEADYESTFSKNVVNGRREIKTTRNDRIRVFTFVRPQRDNKRALLCCTPVLRSGNFLLNNTRKNEARTTPHRGYFLRTYVVNNTCMTRAYIKQTGAILSGKHETETKKYRRPVVIYARLKIRVFGIG